jgi:hypothetical protein
MKKSLVLIALLCLVGVFSFAQDFAAMKGTVHDAEGNALPGVKVTLTGNKMAPSSIITSAEGNFRFMRIPGGSDYTIKFELQGFKTVVREKQTVSFGNDIEYDIVMEVAALEESVTVVGQTPVIDTKKTQAGVNITEQMIMGLPTSRNPWVLMQLAPGMMIDREDVGGAEAGQQSGYHGGGSDSGDSTWNVDGASITDNAALGATPAYLDMSGYEEMQVNYANNDMKSMTGGVQLNFISRRGGNNYSGNFFLDAEENAWQSENIPSVLLARGYKGAGVDRVYLYGANFGGPIIKDRVWFFGSYGIQDINAKTLAGTTDKTWLKSGYGRLDFQVTPTTRANLYYQYNSKLKWGRTTWGSTLQAPETLLNQYGPSPIYKAEVDQVLGNLFLNAKIVHSYNTFYLDPVNGRRTSDGSGPYVLHTYWPDEYHSGNIAASGCERPTNDFNLNGNYFAEGLLGGDHELKFGVDYAWGNLHSYGEREGYLETAIREPNADGTPWVEAWICSDFETREGFNRYSGWIQDTATYGRLTVNLGLRYDKETAYVAAEGQPACPLMTQYLGALSVARTDSPGKSSVFAPRLGIIYDLFGTGKDIIKFNIARYATQTGYGFADLINPIPWREIDLRWVDANGDGRVTQNELWGNDANGYPTVDPMDPSGWLYKSGFNLDGTATTPNRFDTNVNCPLLDEISLSYEKEIISDFAVHVAGYYKKRHRLFWDKYILNDGTVETKDSYYLQGYDSYTGTAQYGLTQGKTGTYRTNNPSSKTEYKAVELVLKKRLSHGWMLDGSFTYMDWKYSYGGTSGYNDPTNVEFFDGGANAPVAGGSGITDVYVNSRWLAKLTGLYQFPYGINASFSITARDGYVILPYHSFYKDNIGWSASYATSTTEVGKFGDKRLPSLTVINARIEKVFNLTETMSVAVAVDAFNLTNTATSLSQRANLASSTLGNTLRIVNPRIFRFGVHFNF